MQDILSRALYDPTVGKIVAVLVGILLITIFVRAAHRTLPRYIHDNDTRYRVRKIVSLLGYFAGFVLPHGGLPQSARRPHGGVRRRRGGHRVRPAGGHRERRGLGRRRTGQLLPVGDRVQLGGIRGDVIDVGVLRTTLMECGHWVNGDLYNGRIVRVANWFVFKEPVFNYSGDFPFLWDEITVPVRYGADHRLARDIIERVVAEVVGEYARSRRSRGRAWSPSTGSRTRASSPW